MVLFARHKYKFTIPILPFLYESLWKTVCYEIILLDDTHLEGRRHNTFLYTITYTRYGISYIVTSLGVENRDGKHFDRR